MPPAGPMPLAGLLPTAGRARSLMRAAEQLALQEQRQRAQGFDHAVCAQLAETESALLVEVDGTLSSRAGAGSKAPTTVEARELLRAPLDALADGMRALLARHAANETDSIKRALASLAADLGAAQEQDIRRLREALAHAKRQAEAHLDTVRRSAQTRVLDAREEVRRECEGRIAAAERCRREAEAVAAAALEKHPIVDTRALLEERASLRVKLELLEQKMTDEKAESSALIARHSESRSEALPLPLIWHSESRS